MIRNFVSLAILLICLAFCLFAFLIVAPRFVAIFEEIGATPPTHWTIAIEVRNIGFFPLMYAILLIVTAFVTYTALQRREKYPFRVNIIFSILFLLTGFAFLGTIFSFPCTIGQYVEAFGV